MQVAQVCTWCFFFFQNIDWVNWVKSGIHSLHMRQGVELILSWCYHCKVELTALKYLWAGYALSQLHGRWLSACVRQWALLFPWVPPQDYPKLEGIIEALRFCCIPPCACCDSLWTHCSKRQTCCMWGWAWGKCRAAEAVNRVLWPVLAGLGSLCWSLWCCGVQNSPDLNRVRYPFSNWEFNSFPARLKLLSHYGVVRDKSFLKPL